MILIHPKHDARALTLVETLIVIAIIALLLSISLPALSAARKSARTAVCRSDLRQLGLANALYADDHRGHFAPGAADFIRNLNRWHGSRAHIADPFDAEGGALTPYLGAKGPEAGPSASVRACPAFMPTLRALAEAGAGFERSSGGYGYNNAFLGVVRRRADGAWILATDRTGSVHYAFASPSATIAFADAAIANGQPPAGIVEYSFTEPRFWPHSPAHRVDPSVHFRHMVDPGTDAGGDGKANIVWLDTHVSSRSMTSSWSSGLYPADPASHGIGWTGARDDNSLYDYE